MVKIETNDPPEYPVVMRWLVTGSINLLETGPAEFQRNNTVAEGVRLWTFDQPQSCITEYAQMNQCLTEHQWHKDVGHVC